MSPDFKYPIEIKTRKRQPGTCGALGNRNAYSLFAALINSCIHETSMQLTFIECYCCTSHGAGYWGYSTQ